MYIYIYIYVYIYLYIYMYKYILYTIHLSLSLCPSLSVSKSHRKTGRQLSIFQAPSWSFGLSGFWPGLPVSLTLNPKTLKP